MTTIIDVPYCNGVVIATSNNRRELKNTSGEAFDLTYKILDKIRPETFDLRIEQYQDMYVLVLDIPGFQELMDIEGLRSLNQIFKTWFSSYKKYEENNFDFRDFSDEIEEKDFLQKSFSLMGWELFPAYDDILNSLFYRAFKNACLNVNYGMQSGCIPCANEIFAQYNRLKTHRAMGW